MRKSLEPVLESRTAAPALTGEELYLDPIAWNIQLAHPGGGGGACSWSDLVLDTECLRMPLHILVDPGVRAGLGFGSAQKAFITPSPQCQ